MHAQKVSRQRGCSEEVKVEGIKLTGTAGGMKKRGKAAWEGIQKNVKNRKKVKLEQGKTVTWDIIIL